MVVAKPRAERVVFTMPAYQGMEPYEISLDELRQRWLPGLSRDHSMVGLNWSDDQATGYDLEPEDVERNLAYRRSEPAP